MLYPEAVRAATSPIHSEMVFENQRPLFDGPTPRADSRVSSLPATLAAGFYRRAPSTPKASRGGTDRRQPGQRHEEGTH